MSNIEKRCYIKHLTTIVDAFLLQSLVDLGELLSRKCSVFIGSFLETTM